MRRLVLILALLSVCSVAMAGLNDKLTLDLRDTDIREVSKIIAAKAGMGITVDKEVTGVLTMAVKDATVKDALDIMTMAADISWIQRGNNILISKYRGISYEMRVVALKHISANEAAKILSQAIPEGLKVTPCRQTGNIVIVSSPGQVKECMKIIGYIDRPGKFVKASVTILNGAKQLEKFEFSARSGTPGKISQSIMHKAAGKGKKKGARALAAAFDFEIFIEGISNSGQMEASVKFSLDKSNKNVSIASERKFAGRIQAEKGKPVQLLVTNGSDPVKVLFTWEE